MSVRHDRASDGPDLGDVTLRYAPDARDLNGLTKCIRAISSDPGEHRRQRLGHLAGLQRLHQQRRVARLAPGPDAEEAPQHRLSRPVALGGHARQEPQRVGLA
jgi:hypothetical protein